MKERLRVCTKRNQLEDPELTRKRRTSYCALCLQPPFLKGFTIINLLGNCQHQQIPRGKEEIKTKSLFLTLEQTCCHLFHLSSKDVQQLALCAINSNLGPQRQLGTELSQKSPGLRCECHGASANQAFPSGCWIHAGLGIPCSSQDDWKVRPGNLMCHCYKQMTFLALLSNLCPQQLIGKRGFETAASQRKAQSETFPVLRFPSSTVLLNPAGFNRTLSDDV